MKDSKRSIYLQEIIILMYLLITYYLVINKFRTFPYLNYIEALIFVIPLIVLLIMFGFYKDNNYLKKIGIKYAIIYCMLYIILTYLLGLITGFSSSIYSHTIKSLFNNIFPVLIMVTSKEIIRYILCHKNSNKKNIYFITIIFIIYDLFHIIGYYDFNSFEQIFLFFCLEFCSIIAKNCLYTYITNNVSLIPTLILANLLEILWFIPTIIPNLGNYITSVLGILLPYWLYLKYRKIIKYNGKQELTKYKDKTFMVIIFLIFIIIFLLISGIFKYKMIAIGSNSMNPIYYLGDAIIYEKTSYDNIKKNDILVFDADNKVITHRVVDIIKTGNTTYFRTKGDNNATCDFDLVSSNKVYGKVKYIVKFVGYPTIIFQRLFKNN